MMPETNYQWDYSREEVKEIREKQAAGSSTPNMVISFGEEANANNAAGNLTNVIPVFGTRARFETSTSSSTSQNVHKSYGTKATPFSGIVLKNRNALDLLSYLYKQSIKTVTVHVFAYLGANLSPEIVETLVFSSCFMIGMNPWSHEDFITFAFSYVKFEWSITDYDQRDTSSGISQKIGTRTLTFEFDKAIGTLG